MDYAWGANGLDAIITQLLNQFENTGPPPADKEKIQALPTVPVTEEHVGMRSSVAQFIFLFMTLSLGLFCWTQGQLEGEALSVAPLSPWVQGGPAQADSSMGSRTLLVEGVTGSHSPQAPAWSVPCARMTMDWASACGSCRATTCSMMAASCPGWSR